MKICKTLALVGMSAVVLNPAIADDTNKPPKVSDYASSTGQSIGDIVTIKSDMFGFVAVSDLENNTQKYCAGATSEIRVNGRNSANTFVEFKKPDAIKPPAAPGIVCPTDAQIVKPGVTFRISNEIWDRVRTKAQGVAFGALVVPFKFRLGSNSKLTASSTIAPYIGYRFDELQGGSMMAVPIVSVGLGLVPVYDPVEKTTQTRNGISTSAGLIVTSEKSPNFNAGFLIGKDFLSREDRNIDPQVSKTWISLWLGIAVK